MIFPWLPLKVCHIFLGEDQTTQLEHIKDISNLCLMHHITQENVALRLLVASFRGNTLQWFRSLAVNSIKTWDDFGEVLCKQFEDKYDNFSLVE